MTDIRESILTRLQAVISDAATGIEVKRNALTGDDGAPYRVVLLDGDEEANDADSDTRPPTAPRIIRMYPLVVISAAAKAINVGSDLSVLRAALIKAIEADTALAALTINSRGGRYVGIDGSLGLGAVTFGQTALKFRFSYLLLPNQL
jgi:hypothetical protein